MKNFIVLLLSGLTVFTVKSQTSWNQLPSNPAVNFWQVSSYDIASSGNYSYFIYARPGSNNKYQIVVNAYTTSNGWQTIETFNTGNNTNNGDINIKAVQSGSRVYFMTETDNADKLTVYEINGNSADDVNEHAFAGFSSTSNWGLYPGTNANEVYFMYNNKLEVFSYSNDSWTGAGNVFSGAGITPVNSKVYVKSDSVFVASAFTASGVTKIRVQAAAKGQWNWNNYTSGTTNLYHMNNSAADEVTGTDSYFIYGNGTQTMMLAKDNSVVKEIPFGSSLYGVGSAHPLNYDNDAVMASNSSYAFFMAEASNLSSPKVVYRRNFSTGTWSPVASAFTSGYVQPASKRMKANYGSQKVLIAYSTGLSYTLALSGEEPVITSNGTASTVLCSNAEVSLLTGMTIENPLGGAVTLVSVTSDNQTVINPDNIDLTITSPSTGLSLVNATVIPADVNAETTVTLTYTFTNGEEEATAVIEYTVVPNQQVSFNTDEMAVCSNGDLIDLSNYVSVPGGLFSLNGQNYPGHYFDPVTYTGGLTVLEFAYSITTGSCVSQDGLELTINQAPEASISTTGTTNCDQNDGNATLAISGGLAPYNFTWNTGNNTDLSLSQLPAGSLHADISDDNGCFITADAIVYNTGVSITGNITPATCFGQNTGAIAITVNGMVPPFTILWSGGYSSAGVTNMPPGAHQVWVTDAVNCMVTEVFTIPQPENLVLDIDPVSSTCGISDGSVEIANLQGGTQPYSYMWSNNTTSETVTNVPSGIYSLVVTDANGCTVSDQAGLSDAGAPYTELISVTEAACNQDDGAIAVNLVNEGTSPVFTWSTGLANNNLLVGVAPGFYSISGTNAEGCKSYAVYEVPSKLPERQDLCVVTVDEETTTNLLVWEANEVNDIHHFNIYRESVVAGQFQWIDTVSAGNISLFNDVVASPALKSWSYRISAVDECNVESVPSVIHKTIHLNTNEIGGGQYKVVWNHYQGLPAAGYNFYRFTTAGGWEQITTTPTGINYFTDAPTDIAGLDYMVGFALESPCIASMEKAQDFNSSRSNKDKAQFNPGQGTGNSSNSISESYLNAIRVYPNPASDVLFVNQQDNEDLTIEILGIEGNTIDVLSSNQLVEEVDIRNLASGIYLVKIKAGPVERTVRVVKK